MSSEQHMRSYYKNIYFSKTKNRSRRSYAELNYAYQRRTKVTEFSKTFLVFYKWLNLLHSKVCLVIFLCCEHAAWYLLFLSLFGFTSQQYTSNTKVSNYFFLTGPDRDKKDMPGPRIKRRIKKRLKRGGSVSTLETV